MRLGVHLPVADLGDGLPTAAALRDYVRAARDTGFDTVAGNDHLRWRRPWLDGLGALAAVAIPFAERWSRFDAAARELRLLLADTGLPLWSASWGSPARLRALAADADGWIASGYNARPSAYAAARAALDGHLLAAGRDPAGFPDLIATVWLQVTDSAAEADAVLRDVLGPALGRDPADLVHLPVGPPEHCARVLADYAAAGARRVLLWPLRDGIRQLRRCAEEVAPHLPR